MGGQDEFAERYAGIARAAEGGGDVDAAIADLYCLPAGLPGRGALAAGLVRALMRMNPLGAPQELRHLDGLLAIADSDPPSTAEWPRLRSTARAMALMRAAADRELSDPRVALAELDKLAAEAGDNPGLKGFFGSARLAVTLLRAMQDGDEAVVRRMPDDIQQLRSLASVQGHPAMEPTTDLLASAAAVMTAHQRGEDVSSALSSMRQAADRLPPGHHLRAVVDETVTTLGLFGSINGGGSGGPATTPTDDQVAAVVAMAQRPDLSAAERAVYHAQAGAVLLGGGQETDLGRIDAAIEHFRAAVRLAAPENPERAFHLQGLAFGLYRRCELTNAVELLDEAASLLEEARELAGGPQHPLWSTMSEMLSHLRRRRGGASDPHKIALEGLRGYTWKVLLQSDLAAANIAVRSAAQDAVDIARQCLAAGEPADAIRALDAGRGLALFAATEASNVVSRLEDADRPDLVRRWRAAATSGKPEDLPTDLRRDVLTVLSAQNSAAGLLDPPSLGEIRQALATVDADALVYLVPGEQHVPGYAVIAPVQGAPKYLALPNLVMDKDLDVERYLTVLSRRDAAVADPARDLSAATTDSEFVHSLDALCDWAWRAAIGPLVERYLPSLSPSASGRPPRMVLVPMGELARVPWQAARRADGTYAVQLVAVSQAASARMLCHSAGLSPVPVTPVGLVVGDPDTTRPELDLPAARVEAYAIYRSFYRGARYVGRRVDDSTSRSGAGTAEEVRGWLTTAEPGAGAMLHLACHGVIEAGPSAVTSYLLLAGGGRLTAEELVALMARSPDRAIALVVLAACRTGLSINGYDEAYSLGTAFLAGGVRSVLSTQWSIPDGATSLLMYMFHHHLMIDGRPVWEALREAQLWMLDHARSIPDRMPPPLRRQLADADLAGVVAWAGFVHWGQ